MTLCTRYIDGIINLLIMCVCVCVSLSMSVLKREREREVLRHVCICLVDDTVFCNVSVVKTEILQTSLLS